jgi:PIN domain nuclease of toxin-antitoxin system
VSRLLVDTHALLWWLTDDSALSAAARSGIADPANEPLVSIASLWELASKRSLGKLTTPDDLPDRICGQGFAWLGVDARHAWRVRELPLHHRDPFDRLLAAQALTEHLPVITADPSFRSYGVEICW